MVPRMFFSFSRAKLLKIFAGIALASFTALAQVQGTSAYGDTGLKLAAADFANAHGYGGISFNPAIYSVPGKPFTATRVYTFRKLRAGEMNSRDHASLISSTSAPDLSEEVIVARDSLGRVHYETRAPARGEIAVMIYDPMSHKLSQYYLAADRGMPDNAAATVKRFLPMSKLARPIPTSPPAQADNESADSVPDKPYSSSSAATPPAVAVPKRIDPLPRDLPEQTIDGIRAIGYRIVHKYGDKNQYLQIQDDWLSPEYGIGLRQDIVRESIGESTIETHDIVDGEPDPELFRVPGGYLITQTK